MKARYCTSFVLIFLLTSILTTTTYSSDISLAPRVNSTASRPSSGSNMSANSAESYSGTLRVYMVEPTSRWRDDRNHRYEFGFLDFALVMNVALDEGATLEQTVIWDPATAGYSGVQESNIMAIAVLFNSQPHTADAYPGNGFWFSAYDVDAAAGTTPGIPGRNVKNENYSHTVFLEEATATW